MILSVELVPFLLTNKIVLDTFIFIVEHLDYFMTVPRSTKIYLVSEQDFNHCKNTKIYAFFP